MSEKRPDLIADDADMRLKWAKFVGSLSPAARATAESHSGLICHKDFIGSHYWIQKFNQDGTVWVLHGKNSGLPGLDVPSFDAAELKDCGCGNWMPATKEEMRTSRALSQAVYLAGRAKN